MNHLIFIMICILFAGVFFAGCVKQGGPAESNDIPPELTSAPVIIPEKTQPDVTPLKTIGQPEEGKTVNPVDARKMVLQETMPLNSTRDIYLKENPTTGYMWNATISSGLVLDTDDYVADPVKPGIVGSGGMHHWTIRGVEKGNQSFEAIYKRPWEPLDGNETRYSMTIIVI